MLRRRDPGGDPVIGAFAFLLAIAEVDAAPRANITVVQIAVAPGDWESIGALQDLPAGRLAPTLFGFHPATGIVLAPLYEHLLATLNRPDPGGRAVFHNREGSWETTLPVRSNTVTPNWGHDVGFADVRLNGSARLDIEVFDYDPLNANDPIGTIQVTGRQLRRALKSGRPLYMQNPNGSVAAAHLLVFPADPPSGE
jgi:hypothetical protein